MQVFTDGKRWETKTLTRLIETGSRDGHGQGLTLLGAWATKEGRILVVTDSIWESPRHDGTIVGVEAHFADEDEIFRLARDYGGPIVEYVPKGE
jgi:hypothetical protein